MPASPPLAGLRLQVTETNEYDCFCLALETHIKTVCLTL